jgi:hypothetical protein
MHAAAENALPPPPPVAAVHKRATVSPGGIAGIVLGLLALVVIAVETGLWLRHKRRRQEALQQPLDVEERWARP